jgi:anthranilate synthase component I
VRVSTGRLSLHRWWVAVLICHRFDAFRSIFPAGTVSGAPKIKAVELIYGLEQERRGVYAGAVGRWDFADDEMDTCIAIRTMVLQEGAAYLQAGGGIVHDSVEEDEYTETINKLQGNMRSLEAAESTLTTATSCVQDH